MRYTVAGVSGTVVYSGDSSKTAFDCAKLNGTAVLSGVTGKPLYTDFVWSEYDGCWLCTRYDGEVVKLRL